MLRSLIWKQELRCPNCIYLCPNQKSWRFRHHKCLPRGRCISIVDEGISRYIPLRVDRLLHGKGPRGTTSFHSIEVLILTCRCGVSVILERVTGGSILIPSVYSLQQPLHPFCPMHQSLPGSPPALTAKSFIQEPKQSSFTSSDVFRKRVGLLPRVQSLLPPPEAFMQ